MSKPKLMDNYFSMSIWGVGLQVLETVHIIATTNNFDTTKERYELLPERIDTLRKAESNWLYSADINTSIETYKSMYYNRPLQDFELSAILKPDDFDAKNFYCEALVSCIKRFVEQQISEINELKSENAKIKRRVKVIDKIKLSKDELQNKCASTSSYKCHTNSFTNSLMKPGNNAD
jgi:hypothetical protein